MKFAYPEFLYAFGVLLIPIIIHLFNFKRYKTLYFSSLQFIKQVDQQTKSTQKLKHILVLLARLLALSALILAFAQPYIPTKNVGTTKNQPVMAFYIDNSFSMGAIGSSGKLLSQARETTRNLVEKAPAGTNFILVTNELSGREQRLITKNELLDRLDLIDYTPLSRTTNTVLNTLKDVLDLAQYEGVRQYILLSDFQKNSTHFENTTPDTLATYFPIQLKPQSTSNTFIDSVWFDSPLRKINTNNTLNIKLKNTDKQAINNLALSLEVGDYRREIMVDLPEGGEKIAQINFSDRTEGFKSGVVSIFDDQLDFDDNYYFSYEVKSSLNVLIVNEKDAKNHPALVYDTDDFFNVTERAVNQLQLNELKESNILVLNSIKTLSSGLIARVQEFTSNGGSVIIIPAHESDKGTYNQLLGGLSLPLLGNFTEQALRINKLQTNDYFFTGVFDQTTEKINLPMTKAYYTAVFTNATNATPLVLFENGNPLFVRQDGDLKAYVFYAGIDNAFGKISEHALFSTLLLRVGELQQDNTLLALTLGDDQTFKVFNPNASEGAIHLVGSGIDLIPPTIRKGAYDHISLNNPELTEQLRAGNFDLLQNNEKINQLSVNYNRNQSLLDPLSPEKIKELMVDASLNVEKVNTIEDITDSEQLSLEKPLEYWRILLILATVFFLIEILLLTLWKV